MVKNGMEKEVKEIVILVLKENISKEKYGMEK